MREDCIFFDNLGDWKPWTVQSLRQDNANLFIKLENHAPRELCCGASLNLVEQRYLNAQDLSILGLEVSLEFSQKKFKCNHCGQESWENVPWYDPHHQCTTRCVAHKQKTLPLEKAMVVLQEERRLLFGGPMVVFKWQHREFCEAVYASPNVNDILGYNPLDFYSDRIAFEAIIHSADQFRVTSKLRAQFSAENPQPFTEVFRLAHANGEWRWIEMHLVPDGRNSGEQRVITGYLLDITQTKGVEEELRAHQKRLKMVLSSTRTGYWTLDFNTMSVQSDDEWLQLMDLDLLGFNMSEAIQVVHQADRAFLKKQIEQCVNGVLETVNAEARFKTKSGTWIWLQLNAMLSGFREDGTPRLMSGFATDISKRKELENLILSSKRRFESIFNLIQSSVMIIEASNSLIIDANPAACKLIGRERSELIGRIAYDYVFPADDYRCSIEDRHNYDSMDGMVLHSQGHKVPVLKTTAEVELDGKNYFIKSFIKSAYVRQSELKYKQLLLKYDDIKAQHQSALAEIERLKQSIEDAP